jgi:hypothetical protein
MAQALTRPNISIETECDVWSVLFLGIELCMLCWQLAACTCQRGCCEADGCQGWQQWPLAGFFSR